MLTMLCHPSIFSYHCTQMGTKTETNNSDMGQAAEGMREPYTERGLDTLRNTRPDSTLYMLLMPDLACEHEHDMECMLRAKDTEGDLFGHRTIIVREAMQQSTAVATAKTPPIRRWANAISFKLKETDGNEWALKQLLATYETDADHNTMMPEAAHQFDTMSTRQRLMPVRPPSAGRMLTTMATLAIATNKHDLRWLAWEHMARAHQAATAASTRKEIKRHLTRTLRMIDKI